MSLLAWSLVWVVEFAWAVRLRRLGLVRRYPFLFGYLIYAAAHSVASSVVIAWWGWNWAGYRLFWASTYPLWWVLMFCAVAEARAVSLASRPVARQRWVATWKIALVVIGFAAAWSRAFVLAEPGQWLVTVEPAVWVVMAGLAVGCLAVRPQGSAANTGVTLRAFAVVTVCQAVAHMLPLDVNRAMSSGLLPWVIIAAMGCGTLATEEER